MKRRSIGDINDVEICRIFTQRNFLAAACRTENREISVFVILKVFGKAFHQGGGLQGDKTVIVSAPSAEHKGEVDLQERPTVRRNKGRMWSRSLSGLVRESSNVKTRVFDRSALCGGYSIERTTSPYSVRFRSVLF
jgi:hypothetical protein